MTTQGGRTAVLDGRHHLELAQADMPGIGTAPGGAMLTKDVGDLQPRAAHRRRARLRVSRAVVSSLAWPSSTWMTRMSVSCSSRWVAKLCRSVCGDTRFLIPAASAAAWTARLS